MKKIYKLLSVLLIGATLICMLASCNGNKQQQPSSTTPENDSGSTEPVKIPSAIERTGLELRDFDNGAMNIWYSTSTGWKPYPLDVTMVEAKGDIVYQAGYERNHAMEDALNINLEFNPSATNPNKEGEGGDIVALRQLKEGGDTAAYDLIMTGGTPCSTLAIEGFWTDLANFAYIKPDADYYEAQVNEQILVKKHQYFACGYYSVMNTAALDTTFVNRGILEDYTDLTMDDLYEMALAHEWTIEELMTIGNAYATPDANTGNYATDHYAFLLSTNYAQNIFYDLGGTAVLWNENDQQYECTFGSKQNTELLQWIQTNLTAKDGREVGIIKNNKHDVAFIAGSAPFLTVNFHCLWDIIESDLLWSILPPPLMKAGDEYRSYSSVWNLNFAGFAADCADMDKAAYLYEIFMCYSYDYLYPAYYEKCFRTQYQPDETSVQVFDMIAQSRFICLADIYGLIGAPKIANITGGNPNKYPVTSTVEQIVNNIEGLLPSTLNKAFT